LSGWPAELVHGEIWLRPLSARDAGAWREVRSRNADWLGPWEATMPPGSRQRPRSFRSSARHLSRLARAGQAMPFAIDYRGRFAGQVTVNNIARGSGQFASLGYWIDHAVAGAGIVPVSVAMVIDHCFSDDVALHRVEIAIRPENTNSLRVVEKLSIGEVGFAPRFLHIDGDWRDHRIFAITAEECPGGLLRRVAEPEECGGSG
jgi:[ribosomal protein S5]-alanine N-acetyltransferase